MRLAASISVLVLLFASGCEQHERRIVLGALPERPPPDSEPDDAGALIPDGAVLCQVDADCEDAVPCTRDECVAAGYCVRSLAHELCSDGSFCTGRERCDAVLGCLPGKPEGCDDGDACTIDRCDQAQKACVHAVRDFDRDGEVDVHCPGGTDCDDFDETRGTRILEVCDNRSDDDCDDALDESECGVAMHDKCDDALDVSAGGTFTAALEGAVADYVFACDESASREVVFTFELDSARDVRLSAHGVLADGSEEIASLSLEQRCGELGSEVECRRGFPSELAARALAAGRYYVLASSHAARSLVLRATFSKATKAPANTSCAQALDVSSGGRFEGDFVDVPDGSAGCGWSGSPDLFYAITLAATSDVELSASSAGGAMLALSVASSCDASAVERVCDTAPPAQVRLHQLPKGRHLVKVSGPASREVAFALDVAILPPTPEPAGESCRDPLPIELGEKAEIRFDDKQDGVATGCERFGADAVLSLRVPRAMDLDVDLDAGEALAAFALQARCGEVSSELVCRAGAPLSTRVRNVAAGDYFLVIEAPAAVAATLRVAKLPLSQPVSVSGSGTCETAFELPTAGGFFVGDTSLEQGDYGASCGGGARSPDVVFRLTLEAPKHIVLRTDADFDSVLYRLREDSSGEGACDASRAVACDDDSGPAAQAELDEQLDAGSYYYVLDGFGDGSSGRYLLDLTVTDP